jgi:phosphoglycolate phosphatase
MPLLIAFDLDGTLIDSRRDLTDSANDLIVELGGAPLTEEAIGRMVGEGAGVLVARALAAAGLGEVAGARERFLQIYDGRMLNVTRPYDGVLDAVHLARAHARVVVLTNKPLAPSLRILEALGMRGLFADVVGGDDPRGRKPEPAALLDMMRDAGATPATTMLIGDSAIDHETALRAGVQACLVTFGFGFVNLPHERLTGQEWLAADTAALIGCVRRFCSNPEPEHEPGTMNREA